MRMRFASAFLMPARAVMEKFKELNHRFIPFNAQGISFCWLIFLVYPARQRFYGLKNLA
jgi:hypothetical protein